MSNPGKARSRIAIRNEIKACKLWKAVDADRAPSFTGQCKYNELLASVETKKPVSILDSVSDSLVEDRLEATSCELKRVDVIELDQNKSRAIPDAYKLGMTPRVQLVTLPFAEFIHMNISGANVIDIGSGKGYLARLLGNHFNLRVFCADVNAERLKSTLRWNRLILHQDSTTTYASMTPNSSRSGNLETLAISLRTSEDLKKVVLQSIRFFKLGQPLHNQVIPLFFTGLKLCGDLVYNLIDHICSISYDSHVIDLVREMKFALVPCCLHKVTRYPASGACRKLEKIAVKNNHGLVLADLYYYVKEKQCLKDVQLRYLNDGYYIISGTVDLVIARGAKN